MLVQLEIQNIALIEHICIDFEPGFQVLSGETGAGKSIIIDSIHTILGGRTTRELIRTGCDNASVTAIFYDTSSQLQDVLQAQGIEPEEDDNLILYREISLSGRNVCKVNRKAVPLSVLREIGAALIDVHGQHDNQSLLDTEKQLELLDGFCGNDFGVLKQEFAEILAQYRSLRQQLKQLTSNERDRASRLDFLSYQINEIQQAKLKNGEEQALLSRKNILLSAEKIQGALAEAYAVLYDGNKKDDNVRDMLCEAENALQSLGKIDACYSDLAAKIEECRYQLEDITDQIREQRDNVEVEPNELEELEERLYLISQLKRKYGGSIEEILAYLTKAEEEYEVLSHFAENTQALEAEIGELRVKLKDLAGKMTERRRQTASMLEKNILEQLKDLEMPHAQFEIAITKTEAFVETGWDQVEFFISPNLGEPVKPLAKIASGGEMSRMMLAMKAVLANVDQIPTLIFDEIDTGISGVAAARVADKMRMLSNNHQVLCVTHLARIAASANHNIYIEKIMENGTTRTKVTPLTGESLVLEIARLLDGETCTETTKQHSREMLVSAGRQV